MRNNTTNTKGETMTRYYVSDTLHRQDGTVVERIWDGKEFRRGEGKSYTRRGNAETAARRAVNKCLALGKVEIKEYSL